MMRKVILITLVLILTGALLLACGCTGETNTPASGSTDTSQESLFVYCGAGMSEPMEEIAVLFEEQEGIPVEFTFGGSAQLLSQIELYQTGDVYMPGAKSYIDSAIEKGFVDKTVSVVYHIPAIAVPKGNPAGITCLEDLAKPGVKVALGEPTGPAIGKNSKKMLEADGLWENVSANVVTYSGTVNELVVYISMDQADATIIWGDLYNPDIMEVIEIPTAQNGIKVVPIGTLVFSEQKENAEKFIDFVASETGLAIFRENGFVTYPDPKYES
jgi:molybdate transport system substrate-binding protein